MAEKRSDVWAFGCVLYEMLAGKRAFEGDDVSDTLANILKSDRTGAAYRRRHRPRSGGFCEDASRRTEAPLSGRGRYAARPG